MQRLMLVVALASLAPIGLAADVLVLRDGTRVQGELIAVRNGVIEFEERRGRPRTLRVDRGEVERIEFEGFRGRDDAPSSGGGGRPSGMRERQVIVNAAEPWTDSGIDVRSGDTLYFEATGTVQWGRDRRDGPAGENNSPQNLGRPMPNRPAAALIGKVGNVSNDHFFIGAQGSMRVRSSGRLFLGINDDFLRDNAGNFRVVVYY